MIPSISLPKLSRSCRSNLPSVAFHHSLPGGHSWHNDKSTASLPSALQPLPTPPAEYDQPFGFVDQQTANVAAAVAFPLSMGPGQHPMGAPASFTARRAHATHLPAFELPPPPIPQKHNSYSHSHQPTLATNLTSVGNLLTPPTNGSADGMSPALPNGSGMWQQPSTTTSTSYGFQPLSATSQYSQARGLFSPSLNSIVRGSNSPTASEALPPPSYDMQHYTTSTMAMPAPNVPAHHQMMSSSLMGGHNAGSAAVTQSSSAHNQDAFSRLPPTPTSSYYSHQSSTPQQGNYQYSTGPSPVAHSPISNGSLGKMSPANPQGSMSSIHQTHQQPQYAQHRPYSYQMTGAVLSNVHNPTLVGGGMSMVPHFNNGHTVQMHHLYGHQQSNPQNDRPFRCDQCPQSFNRNHDLKRHKRIHLAVKPFPCGHCDKSFSRKDALKVRGFGFNLMYFFLTYLQRHVLVKGCGKASANSESKEMDGSISPETKSEGVVHSPAVRATA